MRSHWSEKQKRKAIDLHRKGGLTYAEIGAAIGRSKRAVQCFLQRHNPERETVLGGYLGCYDGPPIEECPTATRLQRNAIYGSQKLLAEIQRVFGA